MIKKIKKVAIPVLAVGILAFGLVIPVAEVLSSVSTEARVACPVSYWFINGTTGTPYRAYVGGASLGNIPRDTRITRIYSARNNYSNIRVANLATIPATFRGGSGWVLSNRVSAHIPAPPCAV